MKRYISIVFIMLLVPTLLMAQGKQLPAATVVRINEAVKQQMEKQELVGVAIGIIQNGEVVLLQGYGQADREKKLPVTTETVFNWASNSKPLCAVAAMKLVEAGKLDLDKDVRSYVPTFPAKEGTITMRQLLCHQSGIQHYGIVKGTNIQYLKPMPFLDPKLALDVFNQTPLVSKPGEKVLYSSYAYILASAVVQEAGKIPYSMQVDRIAQKIKMKSLQLDLPTTNQPNWSVGYTKNASRKVVPAKEDAHYWKHGAGGYKSNIVDFARWGQALINHEVLSPKYEKMMWTRQKTSDGKLTSWGLGFTVDDVGSFKVSHGGKQDEATSRLVLYPDRKLGMVVMTNCGYGDPGAISTAVFKAMDGK